MKEYLVFMLLFILFLAAMMGVMVAVELTIGLGAI